MPATNGTVLAIMRSYVEVSPFQGNAEDHIFQSAYFSRGSRFKVSVTNQVKLLSLELGWLR